MKVQFEAGSMRIRISEAELGRLLAGENLAMQSDLAGQPVFALALRLGSATSLRDRAGWQLELREAEVQAYVQSLPCRAALELPLPEGEPLLRLAFEVDVRDSRRVRARSSR